MNIYKLSPQFMEFSNAEGLSVLRTDRPMKYCVIVQ